MTDETITQDWMLRLGTEDGGRLAAHVLEQLQEADTQERIDGVSLRMLVAIRDLAQKYRERDVSESLILKWRVACHNEMHRAFQQVRQPRLSEAA